MGALWRIQPYNRALALLEVPTCMRSAMVFTERVVPCQSGTQCPGVVVPGLAFPSLQQFSPETSSPRHQLDPFSKAHKPSFFTAALVRSLS